MTICKKTHLPKFDTYTHTWNIKSEIVTLSNFYLFVLYFINDYILQREYTIFVNDSHKHILLELFGHEINKQNY